MLASVFEVDFVCERVLRADIHSRIDSPLHVDYGSFEADPGSRTAGDYMPSGFRCGLLFLAFRNCLGCLPGIKIIMLLNVSHML